MASHLSLDTFQGLASAATVSAYMDAMATVTVCYKGVELTPSCKKAFVKEALLAARAISGEAWHLVLVKTSKTPWVYTPIVNLSR